MKSDWNSNLELAGSVSDKTTLLPPGTWTAALRIVFEPVPVTMAWNMNPVADSVGAPEVNWSNN